MVTFDIDGKAIPCPQSYSEVLTGRYQQLPGSWDSKFSSKSLITLFSTLTGTTYDSIADSTDLHIETLISGVIGFIAAENLDSYPVPENFTYSNKVIKLPKRLERLTIGQNLKAKQLLQKDFRTCLTQLVAIYLQPLIDEAKYDDNRAEEIAIELESYPVSIMYPMGSFFIEQLVIYGLSSLKNKSRTSRMKHKLLSIVKTLKGRKFI